MVSMCCVVTGHAAKYRLSFAIISMNMTAARTFSTCRIPDDCIDKNRYPLFMARSVLRELIESLPSTRSL